MTTLSQFMMNQLLKKIKNNIFVDNYGTREYIDTGLLPSGLKNIEGGSI